MSHRLPPSPYATALNSGRVFAADGDCIAQVFQRDAGPPSESDAMLRAVGALPELIAALWEMVETFERVDATGRPRAATVRACAVLAAMPLPTSAASQSGEAVQASSAQDEPNYKALYTELKEEVLEKVGPALESAERWFRDYERQHRAKGTSEGNLKADTNEERADHCLRALSSLHEKLSSIGGSSSAETAASLADGKLTAGEVQRESEGFSVRALAEVATKAIYTHGFGFREVVGPSEHQGRQYVNFCWDDNTLVRAIFWMSPDEALPPPPNPSARGEL